MSLGRARAMSQLAGEAVLLSPGKQGSSTICEWKKGNFVRCTSRNVDVLSYSTTVMAASDI